MREANPKLVPGENSGLDLAAAELSPAQRESLRSFTPARIALKRAGVSVGTAPLLEFELAHALARDAVRAAMDARMLLDELRRQGLEALALKSRAPDRETYLKRPDFGRMLSKESAAQLTPGEYDLVFVIADGLSAVAVERHALRLLQATLPLITGWRLAPICVVEQGRVAIGDAIGECLTAQLAVVLIGERPGLSSPDSLGAYITWRPGRGRKDAERNCISNIRQEGLSYEAAARRLLFYLTEARRRQLTGVALKDPEIETGQI
ncbi:MAG TPA: ethanolamine ammonia-lyase subunit EutC [Acidobacteriaceae bacterium]